MDRRLELMQERLAQLTTEQLQRIVDYPLQMCHDTYNYSDGRFCPLAVAFDLPKKFRYKPTTNELVVNEIVRIGSAQIKDFVLNPTKGVLGRFYTVGRESDLVWLAKEIIKDRKFGAD